MKYITIFMGILSCGLAMSAEAVSDQNSSKSILKRVPAEWEPQEAIWLQWPGYWEKDYEQTIAKISDLISRYQTLRILYGSGKILKEAKKAIRSVGADPENSNIRWQAAKYDNSWMRDNGPVYVIEEDKFRIQNWEFDAWGGAFGADVPFELDNSIPDQIGKMLEIPVDHVNIVHERGNLEFNGSDTVILNWSTISDPNRNIAYTKEQAETDLKQNFGVSSVIFIEGVPVGDLTRGHIDGIARFINANTVVVVQCTAGSLCQPDDQDGRLFDKAAETIEAYGFNVVREPIESYVEYKGQSFDTNYVNWLVGNGFVIVPGFGNPKTDAAAKSRIENYFPNRDVHIVEMLSSWAAGGGVHCHTNDQPAQSILE
ncbi:agmatine deiminase family protein [Rhodobacteraceae bacterium nBUS_24]